MDTQAMVREIDTNTVANFCHIHYTNPDTMNDIEYIYSLHDTFITNEKYLFLTRDDTFHYMKIVRVDDSSMVISKQGTFTMWHGTWRFASHEITQTSYSMTYIKLTYVKYFCVVAHLAPVIHTSISQNGNFRVGEMEPFTTASGREHDTTISHNQITSFNINANAVENFCREHHHNINPAYNVINIDSFQATFAVNETYIFLAQDSTYHYVKIMRLLDASMVVGVHGKGIMLRGSCDFVKHEIRQTTFLNLVHFASIYTKYFRYEEPTDEIVPSVRDMDGPDQASTRGPRSINYFDMLRSINITNTFAPTTNNTRRGYLSGTIYQPPTQHQPPTVIDEEVKDDDNYTENVTCNICLTNKVAVCYMPCGHISCGTCSAQITKCQTCRVTITKKVKFFI